MRSRQQAVCIVMTVAALGMVMISCYGSTEPVVKIGLIAPFEDLYRADGYAALHAVRLAVARRNAAGGIDGRPVALVALNDNGREDEAARLARQLALDQDVLGVIGPLQLATARAATRELARQEMPWIAPLPLEAMERPGGFALSAPPELVGHQGVDTLARRVPAGPITVVSDQPSAVAAALARARSIGIPADSATPQEFVTQQATSGGVLWLGDAERGARVANALAGTGSAVIVGGPEVGSSVFRDRATAPSGVHWLSSGLAAEHLPADFVASYQALAGAAPEPQAVLAFDSATMLLDAIAVAAGEGGNLDRSGVARALATLGAAGWPGLAGRVTWGNEDCPGQKPCGVWQDAPVHEFSTER